MLFSVATLGFLCLIVYVSLLGDNHKINFAVEQFFADIKDRTFTTPCDVLSTNTPESKETCRDDSFLLETALLSNFHLLEADDYSIEIKRSHFWIPFVTEETVSVGIAFVPKKENFIKALLDKKQISHIDNLLTVKKQNKLWQVQTINLETTSLTPVLNKLKKELNFNKYISKTEKGYNLNKVEIDFQKLPPLDKRLFDYSLKKLSTK